MRAVDRLNNAVKDKMEKFKEELAKEFLSRVQRRTPVITGKLLSGWRATVEGDNIVIVNEVPYAPFVEFGTHKMAPRAMVRRTLEEMDQIAAIANRRSEQ
jgi:HK97 gp10 family phage protein